MSGDPGLVHALHVCGGRLCALGELPVTCPCCFQRLLSHDLLEPPFRVPYPFSRSDQLPYAIVLRSTYGNLLTDYSESNSDLHIGLTRSNSQLVEFDVDGLQYGSKWTQCLCVFKVEEPWLQALWDETIDTIINQNSWTANDYDPESNNCYSFVLSVVKALPIGFIADAACSRNDFCQKVIFPKASSAFKYISLYRRVIDSDEKAINIVD